MSTTPPLAFEADEQLVRHLLSLGIAETTTNTYQKSRGLRSFSHVEHLVSVWLHPNRIILQQSKRRQHEAVARIPATTLDFLLTQALPA